MKRCTWGLMTLVFAGASAWAYGPSAVSGTGQQESPTIKTIYVYIKPSRSDGIPRATALRMTELFTKEITALTPYKVVSSPDEADLIFEAKFTPRSKLKPPAP